MPQPPTRRVLLPHPTPPDTVRTYGRYPGYRSYQLEDHLGNVRVVVGDNKAADTSSGGLYLASRVLSATE